MKKMTVVCSSIALLGSLVITPVHAEQGRAFFTNENIGRIVGSSLGALLGSEIGGGRGNDIAIAAGAVGGYVLGGKVGRDWGAGQANGAGAGAGSGYLQPLSGMPELDYIDRYYRATRTSNVRGGPGTRYVVVDGLRPGDEVHVVGRVRDRDWYMVAQNDIIQGFVHTSLLRPAGSEYYSHNTLLGQPVASAMSPLQGRYGSFSP